MTNRRSSQPSPERVRPRPAATFGVALALALIVAPAGNVAARPAPRPATPGGGASGVGQQKAILDRFERHELDDLPARYRKWVTEEVGWIIRDEEYEVFLRLDSDEKRDLFIERFWAERDPTPGTPRNEYKELHYERLEHANKFFGRGTSTPGWRTDRGRMYITLGEPQSTSRIANDMVTYPTEVWFYAGQPELGMPPFFYLMFYQRFGTGDYKLYSPLSDGPERLLNGAGLQEVRTREQSGKQYNTYSPTGYGDSSIIYSILREIDYDLASAAFSLFPSEAGLEFGVTPLRSEMMLGELQQVKDKLMPDVTYAYNVLTGVTESDVRFETLDVLASAVPLLDTDGEPFIHFAVKAPGEQLNLQEYKGGYYFSFESSGSVTDPKLHVLQNFKANMSGQLEVEQARRFTSNPFIYMDMLPTLPGLQTMDLTLENTVAHSFGRAEIQLQVPQRHPAQPSLAGPVLALDIQKVPDFDPYAERFAFQIGDLAMVPSVDGLFFQGAPVHVFEEVLLPADQESPVTARYAVTDSSGATVLEDSVILEASAADRYGVVHQTWDIDTSGLPTGAYTVRLTVDENSSVSRTASFRLQARPEELPRPFINAQSAPPPTDVGVALERARQYRAVGETDKALEWVRSAAERDPDDDDARTLLVDLLEDAGQWEELIQVLTPVVAADPKDAETMIRLAKAQAEAGHHYDAIRYYERARIATGEDQPAVLNALATEYHAEGRPEKAVELLRLSLELDTNQPEVRRMLERISADTTESRS